jgi:hypothetical protein
MKTTVGLWIDHRKAIIVAVANKGMRIQRLDNIFHEPKQK